MQKHFLRRAITTQDWSLGGAGRFYPRSQFPRSARAGTLPLPPRALGRSQDRKQRAHSLSFLRFCESLLTGDCAHRGEAASSLRTQKRHHETCHFFGFYPQDLWPPAACPACGSAHRSYIRHSAGASQPPVKPTPWTLGEALGTFRLRAGGSGHQAWGGGSHGPTALSSRAFLWADLFFPGGQESKTLTLSFGSVLTWGSWVVSAARPWPEGGRNCSTVAFAPGTEGFDEKRWKNGAFSSRQPDLKSTLA